ncbi:hypothetical protein GCM10017786_73600 [Amycolatopsis deserti]|uniref:DUF998 domain-containing protein n=1 Tax=Amycolatopsis deserti TaxID=185696 RepID=A0ABQ3JGX9_9PSEU|nr:hypothetical protein [Amycolatopsis deserti]GHF28744.1 hypothetical protein GCM10017786_73600 [Amycolatopsis deserti]
MTKTRSALAAMYTGLGLTVAATVLPYLDSDALAGHVRAGYPAYTEAQIDSAVTAYLVLLSVLGALGAGAWLWTTWAVRAGKRWARPAATVLLVLGTGAGLAGLLTRDVSGETGLPPELGWAGMAPCLAGVVAVALLWQQRGRETR